MLEILKDMVYNKLKCGTDIRNQRKGLMAMKNGKTQKFPTVKAKELEMQQILKNVYGSLVEKGYDPISQIVGYILTEDPTYITNHNNARSLICKIDRDELMNVIIRNYLDIE